MTEPFISLSVPDMTEAEGRAVARATDVVIDGRTQLSALQGFESQVAALAGVSHAVALSSGTAALHLGLLHLGAGSGDVVLTSSMTFAATANAIRYTGAEPVFVDSRASDANVDPDLLLDAADELLAEGRRVVAAIPVDLFGRCADYTALEAGLAARGIPLLCDAAESLGARHAGRAAGSFGRAGAYSFNVNKILTTLGGGMLVSQDPELAAHVHKLANQARESVPWYEHTETGYNYRMSNITAALGMAQLERLPELLAGRRRVRESYAQAFAGDGRIRILGRADGDADDNCWLTSIVVEDSTFDPMTAIDHLRAQGVEVRHLWKPMHAQPTYAHARAFRTGVADDLFARGVNLPSSSILTASDVDRVVRALRSALSAQGL